MFRLRTLVISSISVLAIAGFSGVSTAKAQRGTTILVSPEVPTELNPSGGGAPKATPAQAAAFAWQDFIALNWPAGPQQGEPGQRDTPSSTYKFGDPKYSGLLVWETYRNKVEIYPGREDPPGYKKSTQANSWGYDVKPQYHYISSVPACDKSQAGEATPWINLDETSQLVLDNMYAGVVALGSSPGNSSPQLIRFLAKANRSEYTYVAGNSDASNEEDQWWFAVPITVVNDTKMYLKKYQTSPPAGSKDMVSLPDGTIEVKAGWRPLNPSETKSGRFHTQTVRFYEKGSSGNPCYRNATWGLVALHIIQKTASAPYFIYETFEQADNILTANGKPVEDADGNMLVHPMTATSPQVCLLDPKPNPPGMSKAASESGQVILTDDPTTCKPAQQPRYCDKPGKRLHYRNANLPLSKSPPRSQPGGGDICINRRDEAIPDYVTEANQQAHAVIHAYLKQNNIRSAPWLSYKLVNVQYVPYDKIPNPTIANGSRYTAKPPYTATNPAPSSYYLANILVETNRSLQLFAGGLSPYITTEWNQDASLHKNSYYHGHFYNMGGCMGCHGSQGQNPKGQAGNFSVILARGTVVEPETPALKDDLQGGFKAIFRNRTLLQQQ